MFFRLGLGDLTIGVGSFFAAGLTAPIIFGIVPKAPVDLFFVFGLGAVIYLIAAPALYRVLNMRPMHFPKCPHCDAKDGPWGIPHGSKPIRAEDLMCGKCGAASTFVYAGGVDSVEAPSKPTFALRWPRPIGLWKRVW
jgi:hypothetical protein